MVSLGRLYRVIGDHHRAPPREQVTRQAPVTIRSRHRYFLVQRSVPVLTVQPTRPGEAYLVVSGDHQHPAMPSQHVDLVVALVAADLALDPPVSRSS
jgi:hypothetical protein